MTFEEFCKEAQITTTYSREIARQAWIVALIIGEQKGFVETKRRAVEIVRDMMKGRSQYRVFLGDTCEQLAKAIEEMEP